MYIVHIFQIIIGLFHIDLEIFEQQIFFLYFCKSCQQQKIAENAIVSFITMIEMIMRSIHLTWKN